MSSTPDLLVLWELGRFRRALQVEQRALKVARDLLVEQAVVAQRIAVLAVQLDRLLVVELGVGKVGARVLQKHSKVVVQTGVLFLATRSIQRNLPTVARLISSSCRLFLAS